MNAAQLTAEQWANLSLSGSVVGITVNGPQVVTFKLVDANGTPVTGLAQKTSAGLYPNFGFSIAKLIPANGTTGAPSRWVSYFVFVKAPAPGETPVPIWPEPENNGTLKDNGDGTYAYTFALDITKAKAYADAAVYSGKNVKADLDDLTYDPTLPHRVMVLAGGYQFGTKNLAQSTANLTYDFIPSTGKPVAATDPQRDIAAMASCNECHSKLSMHQDYMPPIQDPKACVVCHTEQQKYGSGESMPASGNVLARTGAYGSTMKLMGRALPNFPNMVHHIHAGEKLYYKGYSQLGVMYNEVTYPQPLANCVKCHDGSATAVNKTPQGDNWKSQPTRLACGACHDGIDFATGNGTTIAGSTEGHIGRAQADDSKCALCHSAATTPIDHVTVDPTGANGRGGYPLNTQANIPTAGYPAGQGPAIPLASQLNLPAGVYKMDAELKKVTVAGAAGAKKATVVYRILKDGKPVTFNATGFLITGVDGSPSIQLNYAVPEDGITTPVDWNSPTSLNYSILSLRASQTGPDADGYYTVTLPPVVPDNATMVTALLSINYNGWVQLDHPSYPKGIRLREPEFRMMVAEGYTARRAVVENKKCNACHGQLGIEPSFHSGARNNGEGCAACHQPATATGHVGPSYSYGGGWSVSAKNMVHAIHASAMRTEAFTYEATAENPDGFKEVTYPGILRNCEQCHVAGSYDFSASKNAAALPNLLWTTEAKGNMSNPQAPDTTKQPSIGLSPWIERLGRGQVDYRTDNLVSSPIASSCFGCHDSGPALAHMQQNGAQIYATASNVAKGGVRANGFVNNETCMLCHGTGKVAGIKEVHRVGR